MPRFFPAAHLWGDAATAAYQESNLLSLIPRDPTSAHLLHSQPPPAALPLRLVRGGLRLEPSSDWLWMTAGVVAGAVPLNPKPYTLNTP